MAAAAGAGIGAAAAVETIAPILDKALEMAQSEILGYHKTTYKYDSKGLLKESHTWNASLKAWELALLVLAGVTWEAAIMLGDAIKGGETLATYFLDPIEPWVQSALQDLGVGNPTSAAPAKSAGQTLNAQLSLMIQAFGQVADPLIMPLSSKLSQQVQKQVNKSG
jgi:hypothetical protein